LLGLTSEARSLRPARGAMKVIGEAAKAELPPSRSKLSKPLPRSHLDSQAFPRCLAQTSFVDEAGQFIVSTRSRAAPNLQDRGGKPVDTPQLGRAFRIRDLQATGNPGARRRLAQAMISQQESRASLPHPSSPWPAPSYQR